MTDEELRAKYTDNNTKKSVEDEVLKRMQERCPITCTTEKIEKIEKLCNGTYSFDRLLYNTPHSCMIDGKRVWFDFLDKMYYTLTGDDKYYREQYKLHIEAEWWIGCSHPTSYNDWLADRGIKL